MAAGWPRGCKGQSGVRGRGRLGKAGGPLRSASSAGERGALRAAGRQNEIKSRQSPLTRKCLPWGRLPGCPGPGAGQDPSPQQLDPRGQGAQRRGQRKVSDGKAGTSSWLCPQMNEEGLSWRLSESHSPGGAVTGRGLRPKLTNQLDRQKRPCVRLLARPAAATTFCSLPKPHSGPAPGCLSARCLLLPPLTLAQFSRTGQTVLLWVYMFILIYL